MTPTLRLPGYVAGRDLAERMVALVHDYLQGEAFLVDARGLISGSSSFAAGLVHAALVNGGAARLVLVEGPPEFSDYVRDAATSVAALDRLDVRADYPHPAAI